jgi:predicted MFS family arabinose efflux permease
MPATLPGGLRQIGKALSYPNYRAYTIGNSISLIGTWMQRVAVGWLAWQLTKSGTWLGLVAFADLFPTVVFSPLAGALADRHDRRQVVFITQLLAMAQAVALAVLTALGKIDIYLLFTLTLLLGVANALNQPARLALIPSLVERSSLSSAVALNSIVFNSARFIGPAVAGFAIAHGSIALAFALNAATYIAFLMALLMMRFTEIEPIVRKGHILGNTLEGYTYAMRHPGLGPMIILLAVTSIGSRAFVELLPGFADAVFHRGPQALAWLTAATGLGAMCGGFWMAQRGSIEGLTSLLVANVLAMSAALIGFTATDLFWVALPCLFLAGISLVINGIAAQTLIQNATISSMRGRVMGLHGMIFRGGPAVGGPPHGGRVLAGRPAPAGRGRRRPLRGVLALGARA